MSFKFVNAMRFDENGSAAVPECVTEEGPLQILVNGKPFLVTLRTPGGDRHLVQGILFSEGLAAKPADIVSLREEPPRDGAAVWSAVLANLVIGDSQAFSNRSRAATSSCGLCGQTEWASPPGANIGPRTESGPSPQTVFPLSLLPRCFRAMSGRQAVFGRTGGSHAAAVFSTSGELLAFGEDVGRHNAVDKAVGELWERGELEQGFLLCVSGRVSYEIAAKTYRAGFPVLAAVSAPSSLAVEYCRERGITLIGFCRGDRATVYAHPERLVPAGRDEAAETAPAPAALKS